MSIEKIKGVGRRPLNVMVYENIKRAIVEGDIEPGARLTEAKVSEQMGVSTTPVREAFRRLASEGLLKIVPWKGAIVQEFSDETLIEVYTCREALEVLAVESAIDQMDAAGIERLNGLIRESEKTTDSSLYVEISSAIHNTILEYAKNETLNNLLNQLSDVIYHNRNVSAYSDKRRQEIQEEHRRIVEAIAGKDKPAAGKAMRDHVKNGLLYIQERLSNTEE